MACELYINLFALERSIILFGTLWKEQAVQLSREKNKQFSYLVKRTSSSVISSKEQAVQLSRQKNKQFSYLVKSTSSSVISSKVQTVPLSRQKYKQFRYLVKKTSSSVISSKYNLIYFMLYFLKYMYITSLGDYYFAEYYISSVTATKFHKCFNLKTVHYNTQLDLSIKTGLRPFSEVRNITLYYSNWHMQTRIKYRNLSRNCF